ncbi:MAG TPA: efflux RND transporter periplasmic adaptor subunit [Woeseiaceae bacterium]|nr:efflux RND transporter periplasmic adaptor subunit [Woeseiaceae bacterium]
MGEQPKNALPIRWPAMLLAAILAGCQPGEGSEQLEEDGAAAAEEAPAIPVEVATATRGDIVAVYSSTAPVEAFAEAEVVAKVGGEVVEILAEEGERVEEGQVLARLDGERLRFEMQRTQANLKKLERDYARNVDLKERGIISAGEFEKILYEMEALRASFNLAKLELSYTEITAPIDGVVARRYIKVGNTLPVNAPTFQVTSLEPLVTYLYVPEREYRNIEAGQTATIQVDALQGTIFEGIVARISPVVDPATGTFKVTVEVVDETRRLRPGMFGRVDIVYDSHANALQIPRSAIMEDAGESIVYVVEEGTAHRRVIRTGYTNKGQIEVLDGLHDADRFVLVGQAGLKPGSKVSVINVAGAVDTSVGDNVPTAR